MLNWNFAGQSAQTGVGIDSGNDYTIIAGNDFQNTVVTINDSSNTLSLGLDRVFNGAYFEVETNDGIEDVIYEYRIVDDWKALPILSNYILNNSGVLMFNIPSDWNKENGIYWMRIRRNGSSDVTFTLIQTFPFPAYAYTTVKDCERLIQLRLKNGITDNSSPSISDVERIIRRVEGRIEGYTTHSWKPQYNSEEMYKYNRYGLTLSRYPVIKMLKLELWNGGRWVEMKEGRNDEYFIDTNKGIVKFSYINTLPFTYSRSKAYGYGEFSYPIRATYLWGKDIDFDMRAYMVRDVATKLAVVDLLSSYDFTNFIPEGTDRFSIESRIERWANDAEERLEELRPLRTWV